MNEQKQSKTMHGLRDPGHDPGAPNRITEGGGIRQYEGGKNPAMQAQRSNRQGSGVPTQQRREDR